MSSSDVLRNTGPKTPMYFASDVSVVIPSFNSQKTIVACLESLMVQEEQPLEVIVVDSSSDNTPDLIRQNFPSVKLHHLKYRTFPGPARNFGASVAKGSIVAFIDADCIAAPNWVRRMANLHSEGHNIVGGAIEVGNPESSIAWAGHMGEFREFVPAGEGRHVLHVPTCNISYRRCLFTQYGGFPNAYYPQEDLLFNYLLNRNGIRVWFEPDIRIRHYCREDLRGYLSHQHRIGRVTRCTLRRIDMEGSSIARRAWLAWLLSPLLGMVKLSRTMRVLTNNFSEETANPLGQLFLICLGSIWWARGFASGARTGLSGVRGWTDPEEPIFALLTSADRNKSLVHLSEEPGN
jgi:glycosyltransferase involved in cell wall biosynthesis